MPMIQVTAKELQWTPDIAVFGLDERYYGRVIVDNEVRHTCRNGDLETISDDVQYFVKDDVYARYAIETIRKMIPGAGGIYKDSTGTVGVGFHPQCRFLVPVACDPWPGQAEGKWDAEHE